MSDKEELQKFLETPLIWPAKSEERLLLASQPKITKAEITLEEYFGAIKRSGELVVSIAVPKIREHIPEPLPDNNHTQYVSFVRDIMSPLVEFFRIWENMPKREDQQFSGNEKLILGKALNIFMRFFKEKHKYRSEVVQLTEETIAQKWADAYGGAMVRKIIRDRNIDTTVISTEDPVIAGIVDEVNQKLVDEGTPPVPPQVRERIIQNIMWENERLEQQKVFLEKVIRGMEQFAKNTDLNIGTNLGRGWW